MSHSFLAPFVARLRRSGLNLTDEQAEQAVLATQHGAPDVVTSDELKRQARQLQVFLSTLHLPLKYTKALEAVATLYGHRNWYFACEDMQGTRTGIPEYRPAYPVHLPAGHAPFRHLDILIIPWWLRDTEHPERLHPEAVAMLEELTRFFNELQPPLGWAKAFLEGQNETAARLAGVRARHLRTVSETVAYYSHRRAYGSPERVAAHLAEAHTGFVPIGDLDHGAVLAALYNAAYPVGMGVFAYEVQPMTAEQGREILRRHRQEQRAQVYVDYILGRRLKLMFQDTYPWLEIVRYEEPYTPGLAAYVVDVLRVTGDPAHDSIRHAQLTGLLLNAARHDIRPETPVSDPELTNQGRRLVEVLHKTVQAAKA